MNWDQIHTMLASISKAIWGIRDDEQIWTDLK